MFVKKTKAYNIDSSKGLQMQLILSLSLRKWISIVCNQEGQCDAFVCKKDTKKKVIISNEVKQHIMKLVRLNLTRNSLEAHLHKNIKLDFLNESLHLYNQGLCGGGNTQNIKSKQNMVQKLDQSNNIEFEIDNEFQQSYNDCMDKCLKDENNIQKIISKRNLQEQLRDEIQRKATSLLKKDDLPAKYKEAEDQFFKMLKEKKENQENKMFIQGIEIQLQHDFVEKELKFTPNDILKISNKFIEDNNKQIQLNKEIQDELYSAGIQIQDFLTNNADRFNPAYHDNFILYKPYLIAILQQQIDCLILLQAVKSKQNFYLKSIMDTLHSIQEQCIEHSSNYPTLDILLYVDILQGIHQIDEIKNRDSQTVFKDLGQLFVSVIKIAYYVYSAQFESIPEIAYEIKDSFSQIIISVKSLEQDDSDDTSEIGSTEEGEKMSTQLSQNIFSKLVQIWSNQAKFLKDKVRIFHRRVGQISEQSQQIDWLEIIFYFSQIQNCLNKVHSEAAKEIIKQKQKTTLACLLLKFDSVLQILQEQIRGKYNINQKDSIDSETLDRLKEYLDDIFKLTEIKQNGSLLVKLGFKDLQNKQIVFLSYSILIRFWRIFYFYENIQSIKELRIQVLERIAYGFILKNTEDVDTIFTSQEHQFIKALKEILNNNETCYKITIKYNKSNKIQKKIEDILQLGEEKKLALWELGIENRLEKCIQEKDDVLYEVKDYYIEQSLEYLTGNKDILQQQEAKQKGVIENAIKFVIEVFLKQQTCQILAVLAEGGSGKSMFLRKIQLYLIEHYENLHCPPLLLKLNCMNSKTPSIEEMLRSGEFQMTLKKINELKKSKNQKLILLDGFDEFSGDYFNIYEKLKLSRWRNVYVILTSRKEKIKEEQMKTYVSVESSCNVNNSYCIFNLLKFNSENIKQYNNKYFYKPEHSLHADLSDKLIKQFDAFLQNKEIEELLKLPINLYLLTRYANGLTPVEIENNALKSLKISDQSSLQRIFFDYQFEREAQSFIEGSEGSKQRLANSPLAKSMIKNFYYEYFQEIAIQMLCQKGLKEEFLKVYSNEIKINIDPELMIIFDGDKLLAPRLQKQIKTYLNSQIINRVKLQKSGEGDIIEFRHKSLFESFAAKAMIYDFERCRDKKSRQSNDGQGTQKWSIQDMKLEDLEKFNVNRRALMKVGQNNSEGQVLIMFNKLLENAYINNKNIILDIIEYIKQTRKHKDALDVGSSNLISALLLTDFCQQEKLDFSQCSFPSAYLVNCKHKNINFEGANLSEAFLKGSDLNIQKAIVTNAYTNDIKMRTLDLLGKDGHQIVSPTFSYNGRTLAIGFTNETLKFYSIKQDKYILQDRSDSSKINRKIRIHKCVFSPDDKELAIYYVDNVILIYSFTEQSQTIDLQKDEFQERFSDIGYFQDGRLVVTNTKRLVLYSKVQGRYEDILVLNFTEYTTLQILQQRLVWQDSFKIKVYETIDRDNLKEASQLMFSLEIIEGGIQHLKKLRMSQNGKVIAGQIIFPESGLSNIQLFRKFENTSYQYQQSAMNLKAILDFVLNPEGTELTTIDSFHKVTIWQLRSSGICELYSVFDLDYSNLIMSPDGFRLLIYNSNQIMEQQPKSMVESLTLPKLIPKSTFPFQVYQFQLSPNLQLLAFICIKGLFVFSLKTKSYVQISSNYGSKQYPPVWSLDSEYLVLRGEEDTKIFKLTTEQKTFELYQNIQSKGIFYQLQPSFFGFRDYDSKLSFYFPARKAIEQQVKFNQYIKGIFKIAIDLNNQNEFVMLSSDILTIWRLDHINNYKLICQKDCKVRDELQMTLKYVNCLVFIDLINMIQILQLERETYSEHRTYVIHQINIDNIYFTLDNIFYGIKEDDLFEIFITNDIDEKEKNLSYVAKFKEYRIQSINTSIQAFTFNQTYFEFAIFHNNSTKQILSLPEPSQINH